MESSQGLFHSGVCWDSTNSKEATRTRPKKTGWWFGTNFYFSVYSIGNNHSNWLIYFRRGSNHQPENDLFWVKLQHLERDQEHHNKCNILNTFSHMFILEPYRTYSTLAINYIPFLVLKPIILSKHRSFNRITVCPMVFPCVSQFVHFFHGFPTCLHMCPMFFMVLSMIFQCVPICFTCFYCFSKFLLPIFWVFQGFPRVFHVFPWFSKSSPIIPR